MSGIKGGECLEKQLINPGSVSCLPFLPTLLVLPYLQHLLGHVVLLHEVTLTEQELPPAEIDHLVCPVPCRVDGDSLAHVVDVLYIIQLKVMRHTH